MAFFTKLPSMRRRPSWEAISRSATQELSNILWNLRFITVLTKASTIILQPPEFVLQSISLYSNRQIMLKNVVNLTIFSSRHNLIYKILKFFLDPTLRSGAPDVEEW
jgi:hypothetical protein